MQIWYFPFFWGIEYTMMVSVISYLTGYGVVTDILGLSILHTIKSMKST